MRVVEMVEILLERGANTELKDIHGYTALMFAVMKKHLRIMRILIGGGVDIETKDKKNRTPIIMACRSDSEYTILILLEHGSDINNFDNDKFSCLDYQFRKIWEEEYTQELIITGQPQNIKFFDDKIGILPSLKTKYKEIIEMSELGIFG